MAWIPWRGKLEMIDRLGTTDEREASPRPYRVALKGLTLVGQNENHNPESRSPKTAHHKGALPSSLSPSSAIQHRDLEKVDSHSLIGALPSSNIARREELDTDIPDNITAKASQLLGLPARSSLIPSRISVHECAALDEDPFGIKASDLDSDSRTLTPPGDSSMPLTASSGRVGSLLVRIHRNRSKAFVYGSLIVIGALSHQTWVSGEVLHFDVEIDNTSEKYVKKIQIEFLRTISACKNTVAMNKTSHGGIESTTKPLAMWIWRKGHEGWAGVAPQTQVLKTWNPIVPSGQATTSERGIEASYYLSITIPSLFGRSISARIPLKIIAPNSLGKLRLEQRLRHGLRTWEKSNISMESPVRPSTRHTSSSAATSQRELRTQASSPTKAQKSHDSGETRRISIDLDRLEPKESNKRDLGNSHDLPSFFLSTSPIPKASDELLNEMLAKLQYQPDKRKGKRKSVGGKDTRKQLDMQRLHESLPDPASHTPLGSGARRLSVLRPLSTIGAHCRRKSSDDVRAIASKKHNLEVPSSPTVRASFDDYLHRRGRLTDDQRSRTIVEYEATLPGAPPPSLVEAISVSDGSQHSDDEERSFPNQSLYSVDINDLEAFRQKRQDFHNGRRTSANPFFKGSAGKERLRSVQHVGYRNVMERQEEKRRADEARAAQPYFLRRHRQTLDRNLELTSSSKSSLADDVRTPDSMKGQIDLEHAPKGLFGGPSFARNGLPNAWKYGRRRTLF